jgi:hypothetical protein
MCGLNKSARFPSILTMNPRIILTAFVALVFATAASHAQVKVKKATYGAPAPARSADVTKRVQVLFDTGQLSFRVSPQLIGFNPNPSLRNGLVVEYNYLGSEGTAVAKDGEVYAMRGIGSQPARPAAGTRLRFENNFGKPVFVYELDRWGGWRWKAQLDPGAVYTAIGQPGDLWTISDRAGRQLRSVRVVANMPPVVLR